MQPVDLGVSIISGAKVEVSPSLGQPILDTSQTNNLHNQTNFLSCFNGEDGYNL